MPGANHGASASSDQRSNAGKLFAADDRFEIEQGHQVGLQEHRGGGAGISLSGQALR